MPTLNGTISTLGEAVRQIVMRAVSSHRLEPGQARGYQWKITNFTYDDTGVVTGGAFGDYVTLKTWFSARGIVEPEIKAHDSFKNAHNALQQNYAAVPVDEWLDSVIGAFIELSLSDKREGTGEGIVDRFLNDLQNGPVTHTAQVKLQGVILRSEVIDVAAGARIRRPRKEEFEVPVLAELAQLVFPQYPSAIVDIESVGQRGRSPLQLQAEVERSVALLRLFRVGSVRWINYRMGNNSIVQRFPRGELKSGDKASALEKYVIKTDDEPRLKRFWQAMATKLPEEIFDLKGKVSHVTLAYDRYSDAVLNNGLLERRTANAVMGLEALFLAETAELSYRLGASVAKLISLVSGGSPLEIRSTLKHAYGVRSKFAHGGHLTPNDKRKIEARYGSERALLLTLLDYLRVSILAFILCGMDKNGFINLIENALIDSSEHARLIGALSSTAALIA